MYSPKRTMRTLHFLTAYVNDNIIIYIHILKDSENPDLRDRGFIYWRLLSTDPAAAKDVVLAEKPLIGT